MLNKILVFTCFTLLLSFFAPLNLYSKATRDIAIIEPPCLSSNTSNCTLEQENHCASVVNNTCAFGVFFAWIKNNFLLQEMQCSTPESQPTDATNEKELEIRMYVDGWIYDIHGRLGEAQPPLSNTYVFIGNAIQIRLGGPLTKQGYFSTNSEELAGARLYRTGATLIAAVDGHYTLFNRRLEFAEIVPPMIIIEGEGIGGDIYIMYGLFGEAQTLLNDNFVYIGRVQSYVNNILLIGTEPFQANYKEMVGARLYHYDLDLIVAVDEYYTLFALGGQRRTPPMVHINGRIYRMYESTDAQSLLNQNDTFTYIGRIQSFSIRMGGSGFDPEIIQVNRENYVGAKLYHSGDFLIVIVDENHLLFKFENEW